MAEERVQRRLAAILAADVVGYSRLMDADEEGTLARLKKLRAEAIDPKLAEYGGRVFKTTGDGILAEFPSAVDAVRYAVDVQRAISEINADTPEDNRLNFRVGISLGDVVVDGDDLFGNGVNVAARMEGLAEAGGICISGNVQEHVIHTLDVALEDLGEQTVKNIDRPVRCYRIAPATGSDGGNDALAAEAAAILSRPAVAVLPFENLSGDPEQDYFADGLTEDIITALSMWRFFPVIARNSTFAYKGRSPDIRKVGEELGSRYVLEGSVRKVGARVRVTAQLIDSETGHHVWAQRYDRELDDIFALQDEIAELIGGVLAPEIERAERSRPIPSSRRELDAWELYVRGSSELYKYTKEGTEAARAMFRRAIDIDPDYARAHAAMARSYAVDLRLGFSSQPSEDVEKLRAFARRAIELDDSDPYAHLVMGITYLHNRKLDEAIAELRTAETLNPCDATVLNSLGHLLSLNGRPEEGIAMIEKGLRLSPRDPRNPTYYTFMARAMYTARRYDEAVQWARKSLGLRDNSPDACLILAAGLGQLGRAAEAAAALSTCERLRPGYSSPEAWIHPYGNGADTQHLIDGLRKAGQPS